MSAAVDSDDETDTLVAGNAQPAAQPAEDSGAGVGPSASPPSPPPSPRIPAPVALSGDDPPSSDTPSGPSSDDPPPDGGPPMGGGSPPSSDDVTAPPRRIQSTRKTKAVPVKVPSARPARNIAVFRISADSTDDTTEFYNTDQSRPIVPFPADRRRLATTTIPPAQPRDKKGLVVILDGAAMAVAPPPVDTAAVLFDGPSIGPRYAGGGIIVVPSAGGADTETPEQVRLRLTNVFDTAAATFREVGRMRRADGTLPVNIETIAIKTYHRVFEESRHIGANDEDLAMRRIAAIQSFMVHAARVTAAV